MNSTREHTWAYYEKRRRDMREFFIGPLQCDAEKFDCDLVDFHGRTDLDILADAFALSILIAEIAESYQEPVSLCRFVPGYVEDSRFRSRVDGLVMDYLDATPADRAIPKYNLLTYCMRNGGPTTISLPATAPGVQPPINLVLEAVALLGGIHMAALTVGVSIQTLLSWVDGEPEPMPDKLDLLFKLAGINHNPDRIGVQFRPASGGSAPGPYAI